MNIVNISASITDIKDRKCS